MVTFKYASLPFAATAIALLSAPAVAKSISIPTFRSIEFQPNPAGAVDDVRSDLDARIPAGSPVIDARALLRAAGARCRNPNADGLVRCRYYDVHFHDDIIQDVSWTVDLATAGDTVTSVTVARDSSD